jgi:carotenoid 1,2-hydratase
LSDDGAHGLTVIAFVGSVFSPYYAWARRHAGRGDVDPMNHCALNVALYGGPGSRWAMTERGRDAVSREARTLKIGPSALRWIGDDLHIEIDEITVPRPSRLRGRVVLRPSRRVSHSVELAPGHLWSPMAPVARADVDLGGRRWSGTGYLDSNCGEAPLEQDFRSWNWSRATLAGGRSAVFYDVDRIHAEPLHVGLQFGSDGSVLEAAPPPLAPLPATAWRIPRQARSDPGTPARVLRTLTDAPFYARSLVDARWLGEPVVAFHESLSLSRFDRAWVQAMLPFRMPRRRDRASGMPIAGSGPP